MHTGQQIDIALGVVFVIAVMAWLAGYASALQGGALAALAGFGLYMRHPQVLGGGPAYAAATQ